MFAWMALDYFSFLEQSHRLFQLVWIAYLINDLMSYAIFSACFFFPGGICLYVIQRLNFTSSHFYCH